ncbi:MAG: hypothetical protein HY399_08155 [Elusimicrobia bacterium]|nr:hypothetical protein [Elusimicrobiota bacterium]
MQKLGTCASIPSVSCATDADCSYDVCNNPQHKFPDPASVVNQSQVSFFSRPYMLNLGFTPMEYHPDALSSLRAANPINKIYAFSSGHLTWCPGGGYPPDPNGQSVMWADYFKAVMQFNDPADRIYADCKMTGPGFLFNSFDNKPMPLDSLANVNLAYQDTPGNYAVADALAEVWFQHAYQSGNYDGIFIDNFCEDVFWIESATRIIDYQKAGYATKEEFAAGWKAGQTEMGKHLRELIDAAGGTNFPLIGNGCMGAPGLFPYFNGWMRENFPYQNGGTWFSNMFTYPKGYMFEEFLQRAPQINYIFSAANPVQPEGVQYSLSNTRKMRFNLGSASLGNGYAVFEDGAAYPTVAPSQQWCYDEYGVDLYTGSAICDAAHRGWLGQPKGDYYHYFLPNGNPELLSTDGFETDFNGWYFAPLNGGTGTFERTTGDAPQSTHAVHVNIATIGSNAPTVRIISPTITFPSGDLSISFWAKADKQRAIQVALGCNGGRCNQPLPVTTQWKRYEVVLNPTFNSSPSTQGIQIYLGQETGDVWFDDIRIKRGISSIYRRDFDQGIVLLNPFDVDLTVPLEKTYRKIRGAVTPTINDGSAVTSVTVLGTGSGVIGDALFLLDPDAVDTTPPAKPKGLRKQ